MTPLTSLEIVQQYYLYFNHQDWNGMLSLVDNEIRHEPNQGEPRIGIQKFTSFLQMMDDSYEEHLTDMVFFTEPTGTRIACEFTVNGIYKKGEEGFPEAHGQAYVIRAAAFLEVKNEKITRISTHYNVNEWINLVS